MSIMTESWDDEAVLAGTDESPRFDSHGSRARPCGQDGLRLWRQALGPGRASGILFQPHCTPEQPGNPLWSPPTLRSSRHNC